MLAYNPIPASPEEMSQTLLHDSEVYLNTSRDDAILEARTSSPAAGYHPNHNKSKTSATRATGPAMMKDSVVASVAGYLDLTPRSVSHPKKGRGLPKASLSATKSSSDKKTLEEEDTMRRMRQGGYSWADIQAPFPIVPKARSKSNTRLK
ncbi:hypothetical protein CEP51_016420 [Fusarium floridanum]|uniref:Uncharacterized protein n=1 Tax=Fusarium floridanum TaxID=1325733 RepID=A0A428NQB4_9HYPO|nr:hypothetical protein CEP51_016420 [Fusarium floridanum]